jgi:hypothetical protein
MHNSVFVEPMTKQRRFSRVGQVNDLLKHLRVCGVCFGECFGGLPKAMPYQVRYLNPDAVSYYR